MIQRETHVLQESTITGAARTTQFTITASARAFGILMDQIYPNKIGAAVREVATNAWDAQVEAGNNDRPIQIFVPSRWEPRFYVRDFGVSMSEETVMGSPDGTVQGIYNSLFSSTKTETNDQAGAFGIGSKAPFAYTPAFQVTAWLNGVKTVYNCQRQVDGTPVVSKVAEVKSDEPTGLMVGFSIKPEDVNAFRKEIRRVLLGFDMRPELLNVDLKDDGFFGAAAMIEPSRTHHDWRLYGKEFNNAFGMSGLFARMGCVVYPVDLGAIEAIAEQRGKSDLLGLFRSSAFTPASTTAILDFNIGELSIAASRETLSYDDETIDAIFNRVDRLAQALVDVALKVLDTAKRPIDKARAFDSLDVGYQFKRIIASRVNVPVTRLDRYTGKMRTETLSIDGVVSYFKTGVRVSSQTLEDDYGLRVAPIRGSGSRPSFRPAFQLVIDIWDGAKFVFEDTDDRCTNRVVAYTEACEAGSKNYKQLWWVRPTDPNAPPHEMKKRLRAWLDSMEADLTFDLLSDYDPADLSSGGTGKARQPYTPFRELDLDGRDDLSKVYDHKPEDGGIYLFLKDGGVLWNGAQMTLGELRALLRSVTVVLGANPLDGQRLIGIIGQSHGLVEKHAGWTCLTDLLQKKIDAALPETLLETYAEAWSRDCNVRPSPDQYAISDFVRNVGSIAKDAPSDHFFTKIHAQKVLDEQAPPFSRYQLNNIQRWLALKVPEKPSHEARHISLARKALIDYPMLAMIEYSRVRTNSERKALIEYTDLIRDNN